MTPAQKRHEAVVAQVDFTGVESFKLKRVLTAAITNPNVAKLLRRGIKREKSLQHRLPLFEAFLKRNEHLREKLIETIIPVLKEQEALGEKP